MKGKQLPPSNDTPPDEPMPKDDPPAKKNYISMLESALAIHNPAMADEKHITTQAADEAMDTVRRERFIAAKLHATEANLFKAQALNRVLEADMLAEKCKNGNLTQAFHTLALRLEETNGTVLALRDENGTARVTLAEFNHFNRLKEMESTMLYAADTILKKDTEIQDLRTQLAHANDRADRIQDLTGHYELDGQPKWLRWQRKYYNELECNTMGEPITDAKGDVTPKWVLFKTQAEAYRKMLEQFKFRFGDLDTHTEMTSEVDGMEMGKPTTDAKGGVTPKWVLFKKQADAYKKTLEQYKSRFGVLDTAMASEADGGDA